MAQNQFASFIMTVLTFPMLFQAQMIAWAWKVESGPFVESVFGASASFWATNLKRLFVLLPICALIFCLWVSIACLLSVVVRQKRIEFLSKFLVVWWDFGKSVVHFWAGYFVLTYKVLDALLILCNTVLAFLIFLVKDVVATPFRLIKGFGDIAAKPGTPWIAVTMTVLWCALEAFVFTFVMTYLVVDTMAGITGVDLQEWVVQVVLFWMLFAFVVGSFAIVATLEKAVRSQDFKQIALIGLVEFVALVFEVLFLYREFVDALVPWFAQHAGPDFRMGIIPTLALASVVWCGIRGMTWFLFAGAGTPTIMAIIQRSGLDQERAQLHLGAEHHFLFIKDAIQRIKADSDWLSQKSDELISAFVLPPLQVLAACTNFLTLLVQGYFIFTIPLRSVKELNIADQMQRKIKDAA